MLADSAFLNHKETAGMPKLEQLKELLINKLNIKTEKRKVIVFSEWKGVILRVAKFLRQESIVFAELHGDIPVARRPEILKEFSENPQCHVFLSSETGGTGLNLQVADLIINMDLPWTEQQLLQRIGRIDRLGQEATSLQIINLVAVPSIESKLEELHSKGETGLNDLFNRKADSPGEIELQPQLEKIRELVKGLLRENYSRDLSLNLFSDEEQFDSYSVELQTVDDSEEPEKAEDLTALLFGQIEARLEEVKLITDQLEWLGRFYHQLKGKELYEGEPQVEYVDNDLVIRIKLKNE
jgi:superfamily II DNA/RNA helicase